MFNFKYLIRLLSALVLTTATVTPITACGGRPAYEQYLNKQVAHNLGLLARDGTPIYDVKIADNPTSANTFVWKFTEKMEINAVSLLNKENKAKDVESSVFIQDILGVKPDAHEVFDYGTLNNIIGVVTGIEPKLVVANDKKGYTVAGGFFSLCFKTISDDKILTNDYLVNILGDERVDYTTAWLEEIIMKIKVEDTDIPTSPILNFSIGKKPVNKDKINGTMVKILSHSTNPSVLKFFSFINDFIPLFDFSIAISDHNISGDTWQKDDFLKVAFKDEKTEFNFFLKFKL